MRNISSAGTRALLRWWPDYVRGDDLYPSDTSGDSFVLQVCGVATSIPVLHFNSGSWKRETYIRADRSARDRRLRRAGLHHGTDFPPLGLVVAASKLSSPLPRETTPRDSSLKREELVA